MTVEQFETISLYVCVSGLIGYCIFIMYRLVKDSGAGKFGGFIIFLCLGLGMFGFIVKELLILFLDI